MTATAVLASLQTVFGPPSSQEVLRSTGKLERYIRGINFLQLRDVTKVVHVATAIFCVFDYFPMTARYSGFLSIFSGAITAIKDEDLVAGLGKVVRGVAVFYGYGPYFLLPDLAVGIYKEYVAYQKEVSVWASVYQI